VLAALALAIALLLTAGAPAQAPAGPSIQITDGTLRQTGQRLELRLRFSAPLAAERLQAREGRVVCVVLDARTTTRRSACISRSGRRLRVTLGAIDEAGNRTGGGRVVRSARVRLSGDRLALRAPARALRVRLGRMLDWQALLRFNDGGPCTAALASDPSACTSRFPASGEAALHTRSQRRPLFARLGRLRLLATGDSMIQIIDSYLKQRLAKRRRTKVRSDAHISTGISKPSLLDWVKEAAGQAASWKPDVTVVFIGANDGFAMKTPSGARAACCGAAWTAEYARRVRSMMRSYRRGGRSIVYWLLLPTAKRATFAQVFRPVNEAIRHAAGPFGAGVRVIDLVRVFTPGGVFRQTMVFRGKQVNVRQADGVHLSTAGASIAATLVIERLRADHLLPRGR
jgi:lysophospholipase L1-like esterase